MWRSEQGSIVTDAGEVEALLSVTPEVPGLGVARDYGRGLWTVTHLDSGMVASWYDTQAHAMEGLLSMDGLDWTLPAADVVAGSGYVAAVVEARALPGNMDGEDIRAPKVQEEPR